jgi:hypothetical protein
MKSASRPSPLLMPPEGLFHRSQRRPNSSVKAWKGSTWTRATASWEPWSHQRSPSRRYTSSVRGFPAPGRARTWRCAGRAMPPAPRRGGARCRHSRAGPLSYPGPGRPHSPQRGLRCRGRTSTTTPRARLPLPLHWPLPGCPGQQHSCHPLPHECLLSPRPLHSVHVRGRPVHHRDAHGIYRRASRTHPFQPAGKPTEMLSRNPLIGGCGPMKVAPC